MIPGKAGTGSSFALEALARGSANYLERLVDADGLPYFNVFWTVPAEAAQDWPYCGVLTIALARDCAVSVRIHEPVEPAAVEAKVNGQLWIARSSTGRTGRDRFTGASTCYGKTRRCRRNSTVATAVWICGR